MLATSRRTPLALLAAPAVAAIVLTGVWVAGGVISDDFRTSMALTAAWFAICAGACLLVARRSRALRVPVIGAYCSPRAPSALTSARPRCATTSCTSA
jgi:hypothetical protein